MGAVRCCSVWTDVLSQLRKVLVEEAVEVNMRVCICVCVFALFVVVGKNHAAPDGYQGSGAHQWC